MFSFISCYSVKLPWLLMYYLQDSDSKTTSIRNFNQRLMEDKRVSISMVCLYLFFWLLLHFQRFFRIDIYLFFGIHRCLLEMGWQSVGKDDTFLKSSLDLCDCDLTLHDNYTSVWSKKARLFKSVHVLRTWVLVVRTLWLTLGRT